MTSTVLDVNGVRRPAVPGPVLPAAVCVFTGFGGLLAEQGFENHLRLLTGAPATSAALVLVSYFLGLAPGSFAAAWYLRRGRVTRVWRACGVLQLAAGLWCMAFSLLFRPLAAIFAPLRLPFASGFLLALPAAILMGACFPLIAAALEERPLVRTYALLLAGALAASLAAPLAILPALGGRGALWLCGAAGAAVYALTMRLPEPSSPLRTDQVQLASREMRRLLGAAFFSGATFFALEVIWTHLIAATLNAAASAFAWMLAAVLAGLLVGALSANRPTSPALLFQSAALLLTLQCTVWDRAPLLAVLLIVPLSAVLGLIYPQLLAGLPRAEFAGYLGAANSLGCLSGALVGILLIPTAGSEVALKGLAVLLALCWCGFQWREPLSGWRLARAAAIAAAVTVAILGRWWDWGRIGAGLTPAAEAAAFAPGARYLPPSVIFRQEDPQAGFTTVVEQTVVADDTARTIRTLFSNGQFRGDDSPAPQFGFCAVPSLFVPDYGRALLIGLGTGRSALDLKLLGYREIAIAESSPAVVKAAAECFRGFNEATLDDPLYLEDGRTALLSAPSQRYDLIAVESGQAADSRELYQLAHSRLRPRGVLQKWVQLDHTSLRGLAAQLAAVRAVFPYVGLWYYGRQGMLVAADHPLADPRLHPSTDLTAEDSARLTDALLAARLLDSDGVARLLHDPSAEPLRFGLAHNLELLRKYR